MSNLANKDSAINQLYETIKHKFQEDGVLNEVRCMLQTKMVSMINGEIGTGKPKPLAGEAAATNDPRMQIVHQLIMEYLHWHGFHYTAEMFAVEVGVENKKPMRELLEGTLGTFRYSEVPILLELMMDLSEKHKQKEKN